MGMNDCASEEMDNDEVASADEVDAQHRTINDNAPEGMKEDISAQEDCHTINHNASEPQMAEESDAAPEEAHHTISNIMSEEMEEGEVALADGSACNSPQWSDDEIRAHRYQLRR